MAKKVDATQGNLTKNIFIYTIPVILGTIVQNMFHIADQAVLGNMGGSTAVAAIGATSGTVTSLVINGAMGLSTGTAIILARYVGQKNSEKIRQTIETSLISAVFIGIIVAILGFFLAPIFLTATKCPAECYDDAVTYMRIYLSSAPAILLYNYGSAIMRTLGETRKPLFYISIAGIVNVILNLILCLILPQKVVAVAIATVVSKITAVALLLWRLYHLDDSVTLKLSSIRFKFSSFLQILRFGIPKSITNLVLPLGNVQIVTAINTFGVYAVAGNSAAVSINNMVLAVDSGFSTAATTFIGQNLGAKNVVRVKRSFWYSLGINVIITGVLGAIMFASGKIWIGLILGSSETLSIEFGMIRLLYVTLFMFISAANSILSSALQAFGYPMLTSIAHIFFSLGFRIIWMQFIYPLQPMFSTIMLCFTVSWILNMLLYAAFFSVVYIRYTKKGICKKI